MIASMTQPAPQPKAAEPALWSLGCLFVLKTATKELEVIDSLVPPGYSPPVHQHDFGTESFYVLDGSARFIVGEDEVIAGPYDLVHVPASTPHTFETLGDKPSRILDIIAPAGLWEFFTECGRPAPELALPPAVDIPADLPAIVARHGGAVLGPPLTAGRGR